MTRMSAKGCSRLPDVARRCVLLWLLLALILLSRELSAQNSTSSLQIDLPITNGLIRWWPNLFDVRDEITGQEGVVMGVLDPVPSGLDDPTRFRKDGARLQLQPAITNEVFTLAFWVFSQGWQHELLGQETSEHQWYIRHFAGTMAYNYFVSGVEFSPAEEADKFFVAPKKWTHVAFGGEVTGQVSSGLTVSSRSKVESRIRGQEKAGG